MFLLFRKADIKDTERLTSRTHPTAASMNILGIAEVPPDCSVHEHYQGERV
jgi:hypothetical protein